MINKNPLEPKLEGSDFNDDVIKLLFFYITCFYFHFAIPMHFPRAFFRRRSSGYFYYTNQTRGRQCGTSYGMEIFGFRLFEYLMLIHF